MTRALLAKTWAMFFFPIAIVGRLEIELAIYNHALSTVEIQQLCTEHNNGKPLSPPAHASMALPFDER